MSSAREALRRHALSLPETSEGIACAGTVLETSTVKAGSKAFLFLGLHELRLKLEASVDEATRLGYPVGAHGWVKVTVAEGAEWPLDVLQRWVDESYRLLAPKKKR